MIAESPQWANRGIIIFFCFCIFLEFSVIKHLGEKMPTWWLSFSDVCENRHIMKPKLRGYLRLVNGEISPRNQDLDIDLIWMGLILFEQK